MKLLVVLLLAIVAFSTAQLCGDGVCSLDFAENGQNCPEDCSDICPCRPYCSGRECGGDGCGGSCGTCPFPQACTVDGRCECDRNCIGKECGDDGCNAGNDCDFCGPFQTCGADFLCRGDCTPTCTNDDGSRRVCGNDGCFGSCGECQQVPGQDIRCRDGQCVCRPQCDMIECGSDGCGGDCGACEGDAQCIDGFCVFPILGCCGDGICSAADGEDVCSCRTDCPGCCVNDVCEEIFGETELNCVEDCVDALLIEVRERSTNILISVGATITFDGPGSFDGTLSYFSPAIAFEFQDGGFGFYTFTVVAAGYIGSTATIEIVPGMTLITLFVDFEPITVLVTDCATGDSISQSNADISAAQFSFSTSIVVVNGQASFTHVGFGAYTFTTSAAGYITDENRVFGIDITTETIAICLTAEETCGNGFCGGEETADPLDPGRCGDCGRLRGVISLAVGQKDQLVNITVNVWAHPVNPATFMSRGEAVPAPHFSTLSDSKGFFSIETLSFVDAAAGQVAPGGLTRRFYFSLSGRFTDRTSGNDVVVELLPLWWNYELVNTQWFGSGSLVGTNNSPSLYFYMTPPFSTDDAIIRIILSWGTLISNPSSSLPDLDMVVAGPVDDQSIVVFGNGIVNFENKDLHAATDNVLPFTKIITDSAQGFGPEVIDFQGNPNDAEVFNLGWSDSYAPDAPAQAYEVWIDRPNSAPNQDSAFTFIFDTNSFIVVYRNDQIDNHQLLFNDLTGVEWAYGFYNGDEWNQIPETATMWHIIDFSRTVGDVVWDGFPDSQDEPAGAKYAYNAGFFEATKQIPCGHVAARGANPAYCPATLNYPQKK